MPMHTRLKMNQISQLAAITLLRNAHIYLLFFFCNHKDSSVKNADYTFMKIDIDKTSQLN